MTVVIFNNDESETQYTTDVWTDKLSTSGTIGTGDYIIWICAEFTGSATNKVAEIRVLVDDVERAFEQLTPPVANQVRTFNSMGLMNLESGSHTIKIQVRSGTTPNTTRCRRARILVMKH